MRGDDEQNGHLFSYLSPEQRVPADYHRSDRRPLRRLVGGVIENHPDCALTQLRGVLAWSDHGLDPLSE